MAFWEELRECCSDSDIPWVIGGDFNAIFVMEDKLYGTPDIDDIRCANAFLFDLGLLEHPASGRKFT